MSRPWKHPNSSVCWLRKGVPEDLRALAGKREEKRSLQTRDPVEAKRRHAEALAEIEQQWANLRAGPKALTEREAHQIALIVHDRWLQRHLDNPSQQTSWNVDLADRVFKPLKRAKLYDFLEQELKLDETGHRTLAAAIAAALQRAKLSRELPSLHHPPPAP
jgi:hypothetical protein